MKYSSQKYVARISAATPLQLVIINYELLIDAIGAENIEKAQAFLNELYGALDMSYEISSNLKAVYIYVNKLLIDASMSKTKKSLLLEEAKKLLSELLDGWRQIEKDDSNSEKLFENTQQLFAGLTYNKDGRLEEYTDADPKRGYKA